MWESKSEQLLIKEAELVNPGTASVDLENLMDCLRAVQSKDLETLDSIAIASDNKGKKVGKNDRCASAVCCISEYDLNIEWVECSNYHRWIPNLCEGNSQGTPQFDDAEYNCLRCRAIIPETLQDFFVAKSKENSDRQLKLQSEIAKLRSECEALNDLITSNIGEKEHQYLETLDKIKVVSPAYGNVFIGNHCKIILKNYQKLTGVNVTGL